MLVAKTAKGSPLSLKRGQVEVEQPAAAEPTQDAHAAE
jgi:hypothetical protein